MPRLSRWSPSPPLLVVEEGDGDHPSLPRDGARRPPNCGDASSHVSDSLAVSLLSESSGDALVLQRPHLPLYYILATTNERVEPGGDLPTEGRPRSWANGQSSAPCAGGPIRRPPESSR